MGEDLAAEGVSGGHDHSCAGHSHGVSADADGRWLWFARGYAVCDAGVRKHTDPGLPAPATLPYPDAGMGVTSSASTP